MKGIAKPSKSTILACDAVDECLKIESTAGRYYYMCGFYKATGMPIHTLSDELWDALDEMGGYMDFDETQN